MNYVVRQNAFVPIETWVITDQALIKEVNMAEVTKIPFSYFKSIF